MPEVAQLLQEARDYLENGHMNEALNSCQRAAETAPSDTDAQFQLGMMYMRLNQPEEAEKALKKAVSLKEDSGPLRIALGNAQWASGHYADAVASFHKACHLDATRPEPYYRLAFAQEEMDDYADADRSYRSAIKRRKSWIEPNLGHCRMLCKLGRIREATRATGDLVKRHPDHPGVLVEAARANLAAGRADNSLKLMRRAAKKAPNNPPVLLMTAKALFASGSKQEAMGTFQKVINIAPHWPEALSSFAAVLQSIGHVDESEIYYERAAKYKPYSTRLLTELGYTMLNVRKVEEAKTVFENALAIKPRDASALAGKARILELEDKLEDAFDLLQTAVKEDSANGSVLTALGTVGRRLKKYDESAPYLEKAVDSGSLQPGTERSVCLTLANLFDAAGEYDKAWHYAERGNKFQPYTPALRKAVVGAFEELINVFTPEFLASADRSELDSEVPVIICGTPRSGTSLIEQILASHPEVYGCGELPDLPITATRSEKIIGKGGKYPFCLQEAKKNHLETLGNTYLEKLRGYSSFDAQRITDKLPHNFRHLGFLSLILPKARVVHCTRHPLDVAVSCYFHIFLGSHAYTADLKGFGEYYRLYRRLMRHWREVLDIKMLDMSYEDVTDNAEQRTRELLEFVGLEWNDACLEFHKSKRIVNSLSYDQVKQPIYRKSVRRYEHYIDHLQPLIEALGDELDSTS